MPIKLTIHPTIKDIVMEYSGTPQDAKLIRGRISEAGCWGFISDKKHVHIYLNNPSKADLLDLFAHELAHSKYDKIKDNINDEEKICIMTAEICLEAYDWVKRLNHGKSGS